MAISILNNYPIPGCAGTSYRSRRQTCKKNLSYALSSGSRINSGADDAAGLAIADGLNANITALTQSARNANDGVGKLQVADGIPVAGNDSTEPRRHPGHRIRHRHAGFSRQSARRAERRVRLDQG